MEPRAPGTEDDGPILFSSLNKRESERERVLNQKAVLKNGVYTNVFEVTYPNGLEQWFCRACQCPVMGRVFQHETGRRHFLNLRSNNSQMEHNQKEEPKEEDIPVEVAPGEPVPPGFEETVQPKAVIQDTLDAFKVGALVALEYLVELQDEDDPSNEPLYLCVLCDKRGDPRTVLTHVSSNTHIAKYLQRHFATCWRVLSPYGVRQYKRNWANTLQKIAEAIEKKFGRLRPFPVGKRQFENDKSTYLLKISNGKHFKETAGYTFEELVVHEELTRTFEDEMKNASVTSSTSKSAAVIEKPFQKINPSTAQNKWTKGNAQLENKNKSMEKASYDNKSTVTKKETSASDNNPQRQTNQGSSYLSARDGRSSPTSRNTRDRTYPDRERKLPYKRHRTPSPARGTRPSRRSPFPRRRSPSPRRHQANNPEADVNKALEKEKEQLWKIQEFRKLSRAIEDDLQKTLQVHEKNPEKHPKYNEEWKKFWNGRYKELQAYGVDVSKHDFKPEWIIFWNKRMIEIHSDELRNRKEALRKRLALPEELNAIKLLNDPHVGPKLPLTALSDQDDDVVLIEDKDDNKGPSSRRKREISSRSNRSPVRRNSTGSSMSISPVRRSPGRSPVRRSPRRRSPARNSPVRNRSRRSPKRSPVRKSPTRRNRSRSRNVSHSRNLSRDRSRNRRSRSGDTVKSRNRRSISRERGGYERKVHARESSFERDMRAKERVRTVADLPWERESVYRMPYDHFYEPKMMMARKPEPVLLPPEEEEDDGEMNVVHVLRILTALEDRLGSLGPKVNDLLAQALALEKKEANSSETLLDNDINCVLFETVKEKLKGQLLAGLVDPVQERVFKKVIKKAAGLIHLSGMRKNKGEPKRIPLSVPGVGTVDKAAIAKQIANALVAQGKTDVTQAELEQLINAVVGMAEASKSSDKPITTASFLHQIAQGSISTDVVQIKKDEQPVETFTEPLTPSPRNNSPNMDNLSDTDLQTLLQNFKDLSTDEQNNLINYLKKLEFEEPERVEKLRQYVDFEPGKTSVTSENNEEKKKKVTRETPFSVRLDRANLSSSDLITIESDEEDEDSEAEEKSQQQKKQNDEDVKSISKDIDNKDSSKAKTEVNVNSAKNIISNIMSNINKADTSASKADPSVFSQSGDVNSSTSNVFNNPDFAKTLSSLNVTNFTNIVNSVKKFENLSQKPETSLAGPNSHPNTTKLNIDPSQLNKSRSQNMQGSGSQSSQANQRIPGRFGPDNGSKLSGSDRGSVAMGRDSVAADRVSIGVNSNSMAYGERDFGYGHRGPESNNYSAYTAHSGQDYVPDRDPAFYPGEERGYNADRQSGNGTYKHVRNYNDRYTRPAPAGQFRPDGFGGRSRPINQFPPQESYPRGHMNQRNNPRFSGYGDRW